MEHKRIIQLLTRKLANEATQQEIEELDQLMALFPETIYYQETLRQITFKNELPEEIDIDQAFELHEQQYSYEFEAHQDHPSSYPNKIFFKRWLIAALCLATGSFISYFLTHSVLLHHNNNISYEPTTEIVCGKHMRKKIILPDGTNVWLNTNSKIQYDDAMLQKDHRDVRLYGEAFFDVAKDKKHPFIIRTQKITIKVLGTAFNVKAYPDDHITETTLMRGLIELSLNSNPQQHILLRPKEKLALKEGISPKHIDESGNVQIHNKLVIENIEPVEISNRDYFEETSWVQNKLVFKNESFKELAPRLEKWFNITFQINNKAVEDYRFTGILENETINQALSEMQIIRPFKFKITANDKVIIN